MTSSRTAERLRLAAALLASPTVDPTDVCADPRAAVVASPEADSRAADGSELDDRPGGFAVGGNRT